MDRCFLERPQTKRRVVLHLLSQLIMFQQISQVARVDAGNHVFPSLVDPIVEITIEEDGLVVEDTCAVAPVDEREG